MFKNGKFFLPPPKDGSTFKELFNRLTAAGAGRPHDKDGFPAGPWTPELLAEAISQIDSNPGGVDLRTVQLWFQDNEKGISSANIRWLARVFGCDDPAATSEWQMELSAAQSRLIAKRRESKRTDLGIDRAIQNLSQMALSTDGSAHPADPTPNIDANGPRKRLSLARKSEALFCLGSPLNLPASVFAGFTALGFLSYIFGIHNATYGRADGVVKQVGFLWTANWTSVFMVLLPWFLAFVTELLIYWKGEGRSKLVAQSDRLQSNDAWTRNVEANSYSYWAVLAICVLFAGLFQWMGVSLIPLMNGGGNYATDWGSLAIVRPEVISVPQAVVFTGLAYLYMSLCFYLFFVGLILLYTIIHDLWRIGGTASKAAEVGSQCDLNEIILKIMNGVFRCTILGILIAITMKIQSAYLTSPGENIVAWLVGDMFSFLDEPNGASAEIAYRRPTHYSSLLIAISTCFVFLYGSIRLSIDPQAYLRWWRMSAVVALLMACYLLIDAFAGFTILLGIGLLLAIFGLFDPGLGRWRAREQGNE